jgi:hypothetical protein
VVSGACLAALVLCVRAADRRRRLALAVLLCATSLALGAMLVLPVEIDDERGEASAPSVVRPTPSEAEPPPPGRWRNADREALGGDEQLTRRLQAIGYLPGTRRPTVAAGVSVHDGQRAQAGYNFVVSGHKPGAYLMDMSGTKVHEWSMGAFEAWPDLEVIPNSPEHQTQLFWRMAHLLPNGDVLAIFDGYGMIKVDKESRLVWKQLNGAHHDLHVTAAGEIYVLARKTHVKAGFDYALPIAEDFILKLDERGEKLEEISILDSLARSPYAPVLKRLKDPGDITHTNTIEVLEEVPEGAHPAFTRGRVLVSIRHLDMVCLVDVEERVVVWAEDSFWRRQHQPTLLEDGRILVFDNQGIAGRSRVIELDPMTRRIVWTLGEDDDPRFYSKTCGLSQRLPNGNTLVTVSDPGWAFEATREGDTVWRYGSPHRAGPGDELVATLFEVVRIEGSYVEGWLRGVR